jgi:hypothetical protein
MSLTFPTSHPAAIRPEILEGVRAANSAAELYPYLQGAIELEHATIPAYLTALYSLKPGTNNAVAGIIRSVVVQEMLHLTIACNVLNALGGQPVLNRADFVPKYPGPLPIGVEADLVVPLAPLDASLIENVFMRIERPNEPKDYKVKATADRISAGYPTISAFYEAIIERIKTLGDGAFAKPSNPQMLDNTWFPASELFEVTDVASATAALEIIIEQGEGLGTSPMDDQGVPAHYYRFAEILKGRRLVVDPSAPEGYSYSGDPIAFDTTSVYDLTTNSRLADYRPNSLAWMGVRQADYTYTTLLNALHETFNGKPANLKNAIALMYELRLVVVEKVLTQKVTTGPNAGKIAAPSFAFTPSLAD